MINCLSTACFMLSLFGLLLSFTAWTTLSSTTFKNVEDKYILFIFCCCCCWRSVKLTWKLSLPESYLILQESLRVPLSTTSIPWAEVSPGEGRRGLTLIPTHVPKVLGDLRSPALRPSWDGIKCSKLQHACWVRARLLHQPSVLATLPPPPPSTASVLSFCVGS